MIQTVEGVGLPNITMSVPMSHAAVSVLDGVE